MKIDKLQEDYNRLPQEAKERIAKKQSIIMQNWIDDFLKSNKHTMYYNRKGQIFFKPLDNENRHTRSRDLL